MRSFFLRGDIFSLSFQLFQFDNYSMEESGHCREVERRVNVCHVWTVRPKKNNNKDGPCREVTVKEEVDISSEVRLNITWYYGTTIFSGIWWAQNCNKLYGYQTQLYWLKSMRQYYWVLKGYFVCRDSYAVFRKLLHSRKLYLCMDSASRIFFSASFLSMYEVVQHRQKNMRGWLVYIAHQHQTPNEWSKKLCKLVSGHKLFSKNSAGYKFLLGR